MQGQVRPLTAAPIKTRAMPDHGREIPSPLLVASPMDNGIPLEMPAADPQPDRLSSQEFQRILAVSSTFRLAIGPPGKG